MIGDGMAGSENETAPRRLSGAVQWLAYLSVAPLVLCLAGVGLLSDYGPRALAQRIALGWGGALLAFTGAVHWGFGLFWLYEHRVLGTRLPAEYLGLRRHLTLATCMLLALTMFASETAGLG